MVRFPTPITTPPHPATLTLPSTHPSHELWSGYTWVGSDGVAGALSGSNPILKGMIVLAPSAASHAAFQEYTLRKQSLKSTLGNGTHCNLETDDEGRHIWALHPDSSLTTPLLCAGDDHVSDHTYGPYAYDAVYAIAHALHKIIRDPEVETIDGAEIMTALLNVRFEGATGRISFSDTAATLGDRETGILYDVLNVNALGSLVKFGTWQLGSVWEESFATHGVPLTRPTSDGSQPEDLASNTLRVGIYCRHPPGSILFEECQHAIFAIDLINNKSDGFYDELLPYTTIYWSLVSAPDDSSCLGVNGTRSKQAELLGLLPSPVAFIGPHCSSDVEAVASEVYRDTALGTRAAIFSPFSTAVYLEDAAAYPNLVRLTTSERYICDGYVALALHLGWQHIAVLHDDSVWGLNVMDVFQSAFKNGGGTILNENATAFSSSMFSSGEVNASMLLTQLEQFQPRIIFLVAYEDVQRALFAAAFDEKRLWGAGYAWINAWPTELAILNPDSSVNVSAVMGSEGVLGLIESQGGLQPSLSMIYQQLWGKAAGSSGCAQSGPSTTPFCDLDDDPATFPGYSAAHVDAVIQMAVDANSAILAGASPGNPDQLFNAARQRNGPTQGLNGPLYFNENGDRLGMLDLVNYRRVRSSAGGGGRQLRSVQLPGMTVLLDVVGSYDSRAAELDLVTSSLLFSGGLLEVPQHHSPPPPPPPLSPAFNPTPILIVAAIASIVLLLLILALLRARARLSHEQRRLRSLSTHHPVRLAPLGSNEYHIFLSYFQRGSHS